MAAVRKRTGRVCPVAFASTVARSLRLWLGAVEEGPGTGRFPAASPEGKGASHERLGNDS